MSKFAKSSLGATLTAIESVLRLVSWGAGLFLEIIYKVRRTRPGETTDKPLPPEEALKTSSSSVTDVKLGD